MRVTSINKKKQKAANVLFIIFVPSLWASISAVLDKISNYQSSIFRCIISKTALPVKLSYCIALSFNP
jgi:hypothetical protein